jgi:ankyrin repeat protein
VNDAVDVTGRLLSPVHIAAQSGRVGSIRVLYELGADVNKGDVDGSSPLQFAAEEVT